MIHIKTMAADLCVDPETVRRWERGISTPRFPDAVAAYLGCSLDAVMFRAKTAKGGSVLP